MRLGFGVGVPPTCPPRNIDTPSGCTTFVYWLPTWNPVTGGTLDGPVWGDKLRLLNQLDISPNTPPPPV